MATVIAEILLKTPRLNTFSNMSYVGFQLLIRKMVIYVYGFCKILQLFRSFHSLTLASPQVVYYKIRFYYNFADFNLRYET